MSDTGYILVSASQPNNGSTALLGSFFVPSTCALFGYLVEYKTCLQGIGQGRLLSTVKYPIISQHITVEVTKWRSDSTPPKWFTLDQRRSVLPLTQKPVYLSPSMLLALHSVKSHISASIAPVALTTRSNLKASAPAKWSRSTRFKSGLKRSVIPVTHRNYTGLLNWLGLIKSANNPGRAYSPLTFNQTGQ